MTGPRFDAAAHARAMRAESFWVDKTYDEFLRKAIASTPDKLAIVADRADRSEQRRFTYAELGDLVSRARRGARESGDRTRRRRLRADAELVGICGRRARLGPRWRGRQSADADLPRARTELHARFRRHEAFHRPEGFPRLRPRGDGRFASSLAAEIATCDRSRRRRAPTASIALCSPARNSYRLRLSARAERCPPMKWPF